jgi:mannan endo-1,4-beta-mannosidase
VTQKLPNPTGWWGRKPMRIKALIILLACVAPLLVGAVLFAVSRATAPDPSSSIDPMDYLGVYEPGTPGSYASIDKFAQSIGRQPNIVLYYQSWLGQFQSGFATAALERGAKTLVQLSTGKASMASIASGQYDAYWRSYADEVKAFRAQVILSFNHEMNGDWFSFGYKHTPPATFVAAWRHVVRIFRQQGAKNVTWMWTINIVDPAGNKAADPDPWWPGSAYVNWVGIDGYYYSWSETFASLFGPTIADVRERTQDPILIAETGVALSAGQPEKFADLFNGVRTFGLLGFVLFDQDGLHKYLQSWRINSPAAFIALRQGVRAYMKPPALSPRGPKAP